MERQTAASRSLRRCHRYGRGMDIPATRERGWAYGYASAYYVAAGFWVLVMIVAWSWLGLGYFEEMTEEGKARAAGETMSGFGALLGVSPLVVAHARGLILLGIIAGKGQARALDAVAYAVGGVAVASALGLMAAQLAWQGRLFEMGVGAHDLFQP